MLVVVTDCLDSERGGRERYAAELRDFLSARGEVVQLWTRSELARRERPPAARVLGLSPTRHATHYQLHGGLLARAFEAEREAMTSWTRRALYPAALAINARRLRLLREETRMLDGATALMAFCRADAEDLIARRGVPAARVTVARPGVNLDRFNPGERAAASESAAPSRDLAFVAHNFALKGLDAAIRAVAEACRQGLAVTLTVAGRGARRRYVNLAARAGVAAHVRFAGALSQDEVAALYRRSAALLHPTRFDPFPRVVVEALASGCPVITTARCGAAEILTNGREGAIVSDPRDVSGLADAIGNVVERAEPMRMREAAARLGRQYDAAAHFRATADWLAKPVSAS